MAVRVEFGCNTVETLVNTSVLILRNVEASEMKVEIFLDYMICNRSAGHIFLNLFHASLVNVTGLNLRLKASDNIPPCSHRFLILCHPFIGKKKDQCCTN